MFVAMLKPREQGDLGELSALEWLVSQGAHCYLPFGQSPDVDVVADFGDGFVGVQVKTCTRRVGTGRFCVMICTKGGNQSWNGTVRLFSAERCDFLFVLTADGRRWFVPSDRIDGATAITLGGPKYAEYEIEPGSPIVAR